MEKSFRESLNEQLKDPEFKEEWDALEPEFQVIRAILNARHEKISHRKSLRNLLALLRQI